jgi:precorrin-2/cobalt-factor-2 C20-methyltransferase
MHLHARLQDRAAIEVIAGIPGMAGCWNAVGMPIALGDDVMTVLMGTLAEEELTSRARGCDALVIMKTGRNLQKVRRALENAGRLDEAWLIERGTMPGERVARLKDVGTTECAYFAIVLVHGRARRIELAAE